MDIQISPEQIQQLGIAVARAQLTAHDDYVEEVTKDWPDEVKRDVPHIDLGKGITAQRRFEVVRSLEPRAAAMIERKAKEKAEWEASLQASREKETQRVNEKLQQFDLEYQAAMARWKADSAIANANGRQAPPEPQKPPTTPDEVRRLESRHLYRM